VLLLARAFLDELGLPHPCARAILEATGATKSRAYELVDALTGLLPTLVRPVGRPKKTPPAPETAPDAELTHQVLEYLYAHPGAAMNTGGRRFYSDGFRKHILDLHARTDLDLEAFARRIGLPPGTVDGWLRMPRTIDDDEAPSNHRPLPVDASLRIQTIIAAWRTWCGTFEAFVSHLNEHLRISFGRSFVARVLFTYNERTPARRGGRTPDEQAIRSAFEVYFPDAQWVGDGMKVPVVINGERFEFNLEFDIDAYSGAFVGASIRDEEDSGAVIEAFHDGIATTGRPPLALLLDNRASNHTEDVDTALGDTMRMHSTPGRAQNKAHAEGGFGLFSQDAPPIEISASTLHELARDLLRLRVQTFGRAINHRPRRDRNWQSRIEIHREHAPTEEQIHAARQALEERRKKLERARDNDVRRADPVVLRFLDDAFSRLGIDDPQRHARVAIARYGRDVVIEAVAIFEGKKNANTLPNDLDPARYILGIAKNIAHVHEADAITLALMRDRLAVRDALLASLEQEHQHVLSDDRPAEAKLDELISHALRADRTIDQLFWIDATGALLTQQPRDQHQAIFRRIARRIHNTFMLRPHERAAIERRLARIVWPVS
jgi:hypothetical protein